MNKNALIIGGGQKLGADIVQCLQSHNYKIYTITSSNINDSTIEYQKINWDTITLVECEKFLRRLPSIDLVIFNQNASALTEECFKYNSVSIVEIWARSKKWQQSHYVNCILPIHFLHSLAESKKIKDTSVIVWMLSSAIIDYNGPTDYIGQKFQNLQILKRFAKYNKQVHLGIDPATLDAEVLVKFILSVGIENNGKFYSIDKTSVTERC